METQYKLWHTHCTQLSLFFYLGRAPRQVGRAPRQVGRAPRQVGRAPRQVGRAPRQVGSISELEVLGKGRVPTGRASVGNHCTNYRTAGGEQWCSYSRAYGAHALPTCLGALPTTCLGAHETRAAAFAGYSFLAITPSKKALDS